MLKGHLPRVTYHRVYFSMRRQNVAPIHFQCLATASRNSGIKQHCRQERHLPPKHQQNVAPVHFQDIATESRTSGINRPRERHMPPKLQVHPRKVDVRLPGEGNSNSNGARPVHLIITMIMWIRTSRLSITNSLSQVHSKGYREHF